MTYQSRTHYFKESKNVIWHPIILKYAITSSIRWISTLYNAMKAVNDSVINQKKEAIALKKDNGSDDDVLDLLISLVGFLSSVNSRLITTMKLEIRTMQLNHTRHVLITRCRIH